MLLISPCWRTGRHGAAGTGTTGGDGVGDDPPVATRTEGCVPVTGPIPEVVRAKASIAGAERWLVDLPRTVADLEAAWSMVVGRAYQDGTEAFVAEALSADGTPCVLKVLVPRTGDAARHEATVLRLTDGEGCVRLLRADEDRGALLLERLGRSLHELGLPVGARHAILCETAARVWRPAPGCGLPTGAEKARWLAEHITTTWEALDQPCSERAIEHAIACAEGRIAAHDDERAVLVHGDVHQWNALEAGDGFKLVDPDGLLAEPEYDLGIIMREDPLDLGPDPYARARWLAARTGLDPGAVWEWGVVERTSTGLLCTRIGLQPGGHQMLAAADRVALRSSGPG
jgi:streptomycin 6-kinase